MTANKLLLPFNFIFFIDLFKFSRSIHDVFRTGNGKPIAQLEEKHDINAYVNLLKCYHKCDYSCPNPGRKNTPGIRLLLAILLSLLGDIIHISSTSFITPHE